jgi:hypothetical protein
MGKESWSRVVSHEIKQSGTGNVMAWRAQEQPTRPPEDFNNVISKKLVHSVHELRVECNSFEASWVAQKSGGRERVSFGTNMLMDEESSDGGSVEQKSLSLMTVVEQFHAKKFSENFGYKAEKRVVLKVTGSGSSKK